MRRPLLAALGLLLLVGCGAAPDASLPSAQTPSSATTSAVQIPVSVSIPAIGADSSLTPLGLNPDQTMAVPPVSEPWQASWFMQGVTPGEPGPAVIAGHISGPVGGRSTPGVFARLHELAPGDDVWVDQVDGSRLRFAVDRVEQYDKDAFPTAEVYGNTPGAELRLITCGGVLDTRADGSRSYGSNTVAFAQLIETVPA